jgi:hypothetical protein
LALDPELHPVGVYHGPAVALLTDRLAWTADPIRHRAMCLVPETTQVAVLSAEFCNRFALPLVIGVGNGVPNLTWRCYQHFPG